MAFGGVALKSASMFLRIIEFCCAAVIIGIFSYYLASLTDHSLPISVHIKAVEGISGAAVLYTIVAILLVCCLGGIAFFSMLGMLLDFAFCGAFAYIAWVNRHATDGSCSGFVRTAYGNGYTNLNNNVVGGDGGVTILPSLRTACRLQKAAFAVAIIGCVFFFISIFFELLLIRHRKKERAFGPSPNNGYTAGSPKRKFWQRKSKHNKAYADENPDVLPTHATPADMRQSYATDTTAVGAGELPVNKYGNTTAYGNAPVNGYTTQTTTHAPVGNGVSHDGYVRNHQPYNQNTTGTF
ncbi:hypothetical protein BKA65DRAFT_519199 [Rhexocercosporidium sp. MPI-PUGE-AT-0058]|nr:hypothetical protein BKA65DRAFT_519199 [Rhexocercosporidium sp. MPI-PUGE-AT-0058]